MQSENAARSEQTLPRREIGAIGARVAVVPSRLPCWQNQQLRDASRGRNRLDRRLNEYR